MPPSKNYDIYGIVFKTACKMPAEQRDNPWLLYHAIANALDSYISTKCVDNRRIVVEPPHDIFDTKNTDDLPAEIKPRKKSTQPEPDTADTPTDDALPAVEPDWASGKIDLTNNYIGSYSNPCSTTCGKHGYTVYQTELWLYNMETGYLSVVDTEWTSLEQLRATLDPYVKYAKKHRKLEKFVDTEINEQMDNIRATCKQFRAEKNQSRLQYYVQLYNLGFKPSQIAQEMGITKQSVYTYKNTAKSQGLIK